MNDFKAKFELTPDENVFVAKRNIVDYIWKSISLEGLRLTYPEVASICAGWCVANVKVDNVIAVNNLKHAWQFLLGTLERPTDFTYICELNHLVGGDNLIYNSGYIRAIPVSIGGTSWKPEIPIEADLKDRLRDIMTISNPTLRSIDLMLYCMRAQMFIDGNKRTSMLAANHEMIKNGCGIISVPIEEQPNFTKLLVQFYETGSMDAIRKFVYDKCIDGLDLRAQEKARQEAQATRFFDPGTQN